MPEAVIVANARSPIGRVSKGSLRDLRPDDLAAQMIEAALSSVPQLDPTDIDDLLLGCAQPAGEAGFNMARVVAILAGLHDVPGTTVNRYCASSVQTTQMALHAIRAGEGDVFISAGVETASRFVNGTSDSWPNTKNPRFESAGRRSEEDAGEGWKDPRLVGDLPDAYVSMGITAENVAQLMGVSRREQDEFAVRSQNLAEAATVSGFWQREITPVTLPNGDKHGTDDCPRAGVTMESLGQLKPVFRPDGTVTAGNCCPLNDGAAALVVMSDTKAKALGITPLARIVSTAATGVSPEIMGLGPVEATRKALARANMSINDIDLVEINEAFAAQVIPSARELGIDFDKLNTHGGAIALGHPFGMTGARTTTTLIHALKEQDGQFGLQSMCVGGGQGMALILERLS